MKAQMRTANKVEAPVALILAEQELADGTVTVKEMATSEQQTMPRDQVVAWMRQRPAPCAT